MSTTVGVGISKRKDPFLAAQEASKLALYQLHHRKISLAVLFSSVHFASKRLLDGIKYALGPIPLIGCTGSAVISSDDISKYAVGLMLISSDKMKFGKANALNIRSVGVRESGQAFAQKALKDLGSTQRDLALVFSDGLIENGSDLLRGIKSVLGFSFPVFGGSSGDNLRFLKTFQYIDDEIHADSLTGVILSGERGFGIGLRHGWKPLGKPRRITEVWGNVIKKIDDKPAVSIYQDYFGRSQTEIQKMLIRMSIFYPLGLYVPGEEEYLLRNALRIDEDGGLVCQGDAMEGSDIRLMMGTKEWALEAAKQAAQEAKDALADNIPKAAIIFESIARNKLLGRLTFKELSLIKEVLGDIPILGICTFGEQAPLKSLKHHGETYFHNESLAILTIGEKHARP